MLCCVFLLPFASAAVTDHSRNQFQKAYAKALAGDSTILSKSRNGLADYPLWPDLEAAWYRGQLGKVSDERIEKFVAKYPSLSSVGELRYRWIRSLAKRNKWSMLRQAVATHYPETSDSLLKCLDMRARMKLQPGKATFAAALDLWTSGSSLPDECDPVFNELSNKKLITTKRTRQRIDLALQKGNISLAKYLAKSAHRKDVERVNLWAQMRHNPVAKLSAHGKFRDNKANRELLLYGIKRAARRDPKATFGFWPKYKKQYRFDDEQDQQVERGIALSAARDHLEESHAWLRALESHDKDSASWLVRRALAERDWPSVYEAMAKLPQDIQQDDTWMYWKARSVEAMGQSDDATGIYNSVADNRSYYGFLAADRLETPYQFNHQDLLPDEAAIKELAANPGLIRAYELYAVNLHGFARSEWDRTIASLDQHHKQQAAILAGRWQWHSRAISTAAKTAASDLILSHPTPYSEYFDTATNKSGIDPTWAYGIARSESLFMPDVRSRANAYGLMQLLPSTARLTAKSAHISYRGRSTLLNPKSNIQLGTHYLGQIFHQFGNNQVLATAAYNAGPHRVKQWLPKETWQADIWVENIPFTETRRYVKRVLKAQAITYWRLTGKEKRLAGVMPPILTNPGTANRFASN